MSKKLFQFQARPSMHVSFISDYPKLWNYVNLKYMFRRETTAIIDNKHNRACHYWWEMMPLDGGKTPTFSLHRRSKEKRTAGEIQSGLVLNDEGPKWDPNIFFKLPIN